MWGVIRWLFEIHLINWIRENKTDKTLSFLPRQNVVQVNLKALATNYRRKTDRRASQNILFFPGQKLSGLRVCPRRNLYKCLFTSMTLISLNTCVDCETDFYYYYIFLKKGPRLHEMVLTQKIKNRHALISWKKKFVIRKLREKNGRHVKFWGYLLYLLTHLRLHVIINGTWNEREKEKKNFRFHRLFAWGTNFVYKHQLRF